MAEDLQRLFAEIRDFGWNPKKREVNLRERNFDFDDAREVLKHYTLIRRSDRHGENRYQVFGYFKGEEVSVVCTIRGSLCHIISARRASRSERRRFFHRLEGHSEPRQD